MITLKTAKTKDDILIIEWLAEEIWTKHYATIITQAQITYMLDKFQSFEAIEKHISDGYVYYIAYCDGDPCGYCAFSRDHGLFLSKFYVLQSHRGKGVGKKMMSAMFAFATKHGEDRIWLTCNKQNTHTLAVYKRLGFDITDDVIADIGGGYVMDDYLLEKKV